MKSRGPNKVNNKIIWGIGLITLLILIFMVKIDTKKTKGNQAQIAKSTIQSKTNTYHSKLLGITINIPEGIVFKEETPLQEIILEKNGKTIKFHSFGTNRSYNDITDLLNDVYRDERNINVLDSQKVILNGVDCEIVIEEYSNQPTQNNKSYYCYKNSNSFLSISTLAPELYSDLDQIARSFRYEP